MFTGVSFLPYHTVRQQEAANPPPRAMQQKHDEQCSARMHPIQTCAPHACPRVITLCPAFTLPTARAVLTVSAHTITTRNRLAL